MNTKTTLIAAGGLLAVFALAGCSTAQSSTAQSPAPTAASSSAASSVALNTTSSTLGTIVVDGNGLTAYVFDDDHAGEAASACTGACAATWPAITTSSSSPTVTGVTGTIGTIATADGHRQVTLNGLPLYTYAADRGRGDTHGQGVGGTWWVVGSDGVTIGHDVGDDNPGGGGDGGTDDNDPMHGGSNDGY